MTRADVLAVLCAAIKNVVGEKSANKRAFIKLELYLPKSARIRCGLANLL